MNASVCAINRCLVMYLCFWMRDPAWRRSPLNQKGSFSYICFCVHSTNLALSLVCLSASLATFNGSRQTGFRCKYKCHCNYGGKKSANKQHKGAHRCRAVRVCEWILQQNVFACCSVLVCFSSGSAVPPPFISPTYFILDFICFPKKFWKTLWIFWIKSKVLIYLALLFNWKFYSSFQLNKVWHRFMHQLLCVSSGPLSFFAPNNLMPNKKHTGTKHVQ